MKKGIMDANSFNTSHPKVNSSKKTKQNSSLRALIRIRTLRYPVKIKVHGHCLQDDTKSFNPIWTGGGGGESPPPLPETP